MDTLEELLLALLIQLVERRHCVRHHAATENAQSDSSIFLAWFDTLRWFRHDLTETLWIEAPCSPFC